MGPIRGSLFLFPYGMLAFWLGLCWYKKKNWSLSLSGGVVLGTVGFLIRVISLSILVGDNLWIIIIRASYSLVNKFIELVNLPFSPSLIFIQLVAILLIIFQEIIYVLTIHILAYALFPRLKSTIPDPPNILNSLVEFNL